MHESRNQQPAPGGKFEIQLQCDNNIYESVYTYDDIAATKYYYRCLILRLFSFSDMGRAGGYHKFHTYMGHTKH